MSFAELTDYPEIFKYYDENNYILNYLQNKEIEDDEIIKNCNDFVKKYQIQAGIDEYFLPKNVTKFVNDLESQNLQDTEDIRFFLTTSQQYIFVASPHLSGSHRNKIYQVLIDKYNVKIHPSMYTGDPTIVYEFSDIMKPELEKKGIFLEQLTKVLSVFDKNPKLKDGNGQTPFHYAVECGNLEVVEFLLDICVEYINDKDHNGDTALKLALDYYHYDIFVKLLPLSDHKSREYVTESVSGFPFFTKTILEIACQKPGCIQYVQALFKHTNEIPDNILNLALEAKENETVKILIEDPRTNPNVIVNNYPFGFAYSPLVLAVQYDNFEAVNLLLERPDIDPNIVYNKHYDDDDIQFPGEMAFSTAILRRNLHMIKKFIQNPKVDTNQQNLMGNTALHNLIKDYKQNEEKIKLIEFLLLHDSKIDVNVKNNDGKTPLDLAEEIPEIKYLLTDFLDKITESRKQIMVNYVARIQPDIISQNPEKQLKRDQLRLGPDLINEVTSFLKWEDLPRKIQNTLLPSEIRKKMNF